MKKAKEGRKQKRTEIDEDKNEKLCLEKFFPLLTREHERKDKKIDGSENSEVVIVGEEREMRFIQEKASFEFLFGKWQLAQKFSEWRQEVWRNHDALRRILDRLEKSEKRHHNEQNDQAFNSRKKWIFLCKTRS